MPALWPQPSGRPTVRVRVLAHGEGLPLPAYETAGAAGLDLCAATAGTQVLAPGERAAIPTGMVVVIPEGFEGQVRPRSGLALRHGVTVINAPGTIDSDYRGELKVLLWNAGQEPFAIERGMRIAQLVVAPVVQVRIAVTDEVGMTERGEGGFGSTGV